MLHDLILLDKKDGKAVGSAKIDITFDRENVNQKQVSVNDFTFFPVKGTEEVIVEKNTLLEKIERFIQPMNYLMQEVVDKFNSIGVEVELDGVKLQPTVQPTTTTTTLPEETTTTTTNPE